MSISNGAPIVSGSDANIFLPTLEAAHQQLARFRPDAYAATRNSLDGAVSRLSPYLTHGLLNLVEVFRSVDARHPLDASHKFVFELGWRSYFRHAWGFLSDGLHDSIHDGPLADAMYSQHMPEDVVTGRTGVPVIDCAVQELYATGYLHNHARLWLASYLVHLRRVHWHCGAQWLLSHLLDGDLASNHLSWQWVAGTSSVKPYLFNADNVAKFAPARWHSSNTVIDNSYEAIRAIAYGGLLPQSENRANAGDPLTEPLTCTRPAAAGWEAPDEAVTHGRTIWLVHPWSLGATPKSLPSDVLCIGVGIAECHAATPWSERRWEFVSAGMKARVEHLWWGDADLIAKALEHVKAIHWQAEPHADAALSRLGAILRASERPGFLVIHIAPALFEPVQDYCPSFSQWWRRTSLKR